ncbi:hypothetical protein EPA93_06465 [Ktedonosporobacter rubrisoli]|uniref:Zinc finger CGNR domain-containing protein n=1 Tax=Ktedonosporobacter rubrisoli TaxID=2509675 RepID=A0A4P6JKI6_KTERU|nr:ABATE domain-containing protein [Ktedonosporobacter rubrisoli]QBD75665.1 hypothetical protein EPA93_06465 [Ktedonosporobacter rubrisoli]
MAIISKPQPGFEFIGGSVCLDFVNTVHRISGKLYYEGLTSYSNLLAWSRLAGLIAESEAEALQQKARRDEEKAKLVLERALLLREAIYSLFMAFISESRPATADLETLNAELMQGTSGARINLTADGYQWEWRQNEEGSLDQILGPLARSAALLLTSAEAKLIRQCANARCEWLFIDATKNHSRQYCRTNICGNKVRVRRHRSRQQSESPGKMEV